MLEIKTSMSNDELIASIEDNDERMSLAKDLIRTMDLQVRKCEIANFAVGEMCRLNKRKLHFLEVIISNLKIAIESETADLLNHIGGYLNAPAIDVNINGTLRHVILKTGNMECNKDRVFYCYSAGEDPRFYPVCDLRIEETLDTLALVRTAVNQPKNIKEYGEYRYKN